MPTDKEIKFKWKKGFPDISGQYLVMLDGDEMCVSFWNDGTSTSTWGDKIDRGWTVLRNSNATVIKWVKTSDLT